MGSIRFPRVAAGNDIWIKVKCNLVTYYDNEVDYDGIDLNACQSIRFNLICTQHNIDIDANYEILDTSTLKAFIPKRLLHTGGVYKFQISGVDKDGYEWSYVAPRTQSFIVTDESDSVAVGTILDFSAGLLTPISSIVKRDYMTKQEVLYAIDNADLSEYATNADLENYVKLSTLEEYATLEDLEDYATIGDLSYFATHEQLGYYATLDDIKDIATRQWVYDQQYLTEHQSLDNYYTRTEVDDLIGVVDAKFDNYYTRAQCDERYLTYHQDISGKQDVIADLDEIRRGATLGSSSLQPSALNNYYTRTQVDAAIANASQNVDLTDYYTKSETDAAINEAIAYADIDVDLSNYVTLDNFNETSYSVAYNISYLEDKINNIDTSGTTVDLSDYVTYAYLAEKDYSTSSDLDENYNILHQEIAAKQDTINDLSTIRTGAAAGATAVQPAALNNYYTKSQVDAEIDNQIQDVYNNIDLTGYVTVENFNETSFTVAYAVSYLQDQINNIDTSGATVDLSDYVTYSYLSDKLLEQSGDLMMSIEGVHDEVNGVYSYLGSYYMTDSEMRSQLDGMDNTIQINLQTKQDTINDLSTIRSGAAAGATAVQPAALNDYYTKSQVDAAIKNATPNIDLSSYVTVDEYNKSSYTIAYNISYLEDKINNIDTSGTSVDLSDYVTYTYADANYLREHQSLDNYYTKSQVYSKTEADNKYLTSHQSLDNYYTKSQVYSKTEADNKYLTSHQSLDNYYTKSQVDTAIANATPTVDLSSYVTYSYADANYLREHQSLANYVTYSYANANYLREHQSLSNYYTKSQVYSKTESDAKYLTQHQSLSNYYTKSEVDAAIPDTSTLAPASYLGGLKLQTLTQSQYDALSTKDSTTLYIITD